MKPCAGFSLVEVSVASLIVSVGSLAVLQMSRHWYANAEHLTTRMEALDRAVELRPEPSIPRRYEFLSCERDK